jgi:transposase
MIDYSTYCQIQSLHREQGLRVAQIARQLGLDVKTVTRWLAEKKYRKVQVPPRPSKLDGFKGQILRWLEAYPYSGRQIFQRLREADYQGGYTILTQFLRQVRPRTKPAFLTLHFEPGQCAQVDWASCGSIPVGNTSRRLSCFVMVLSYSRLMYLEFTLSQAQEHFLACHRHALEYFGASPREVMVDNCKVAVLSRPAGQPPLFQPRYLDFAQHYGFAIKACAVRAPQQKGRVENAVAYVKKNFLAGLELSSLAALNLAARHWLETVANLRTHAATGQPPAERFAREKPRLRPLPTHPYDVGQLRPVRASNRFRVTVDTNRYSVPARYAGARLDLKLYPERVCLYHQNQLLADHPRSYQRGQDFEHPDHVRPLLLQRRKNRNQQLLLRFLQLSPQAEAYYEQLQSRRLPAPGHVRKILALSETYGPEKVARALEDAATYGAYSSEYIANLLEQRARQLPEPGALHLTRSEDLLELDLPEPDLSLYQDPDSDPDPQS